MAQKELDAWVADYNTERPHQSLGMATPAERFSVRDELGARAWLPTCELSSDDRSGDDWVDLAPSRSTASSRCPTSSSAWASTEQGTSSTSGSIENFLEVWDGPELVKTVLRTSKGVVRKKKAEMH